MPCSCAPHSELAGWGLITVWLPVRVLPAPPRSPARTPSSPSPRNTLDFPRFGAGVMARSRSLRETKTVRKRIGALRLWRPKSVSRCAVKARPETRFACDRDRFACKRFEMVRGRLKRLPQTTTGKPMFEFSRKVEPLDLAIKAPTQPGPFVFRVKAVSGCGSTSPDIDVPHGWAARKPMVLKAQTTHTIPAILSLPRVASMMAPTAEWIPHSGRSHSIVDEDHRARRKSLVLDENIILPTPHSEQDAPK
jgi:hypothetical protein